MNKAVTPAPAGSAGARALHCLQMSNALHIHSDAATARAAEGKRSPAYPRLVIATTILASSLAFIDSSVVNVGLPAIGRSFHADAIGLQWVVNGYLLPLSALLLLGGAAGDRYGRRRLLTTGVLLFGIASLACAVAPTLILLQLARFVQGASAAMLMPNSLAILGQSFSGEAKGRAIGVWAATGAAAAAMGPVLGGWLIDAGSWRLAFLINVPLSVAAITLASRYVDKDVDDAAGSLDWLGGALATAGADRRVWPRLVAFRLRRPGSGLDLLAPVSVCGATARRQGHDAAHVIRLLELRRPHAFDTPAVRRSRRLVRACALCVDPSGWVHRDAGRRRTPAPATDNRRGIACGWCAGGQGGSTMAVDHRTGHRRGRLSPNAADRVGHKLLAWGVSRDGRDCFGNVWSGRPAHDGSVDVRQQQTHGCSIRAEQRGSAYWRFGCHSPYRTCDSVIRTCLAFSFWCRCSDGRSHLLASSGERCYVDRPGGRTEPSVTMMTVAPSSCSQTPRIPDRRIPSSVHSTSRTP
jgi:hypothetical protein